MQIQLPEEIRSFYFEFNWENQKVWRLSADAEESPIAEHLWHLDYPFWSSRPPLPLFDLRPNHVLADSTLHPGHFKRIESADLRYPIDTLFHRKKWIILDGMHRLARYALEGHGKIWVRKHQPSIIPSIRR